MRIPKFNDSFQNFDSNTYNPNIEFFPIPDSNPQRRDGPKGAPTPTSRQTLKRRGGAKGLNEKFQGTEPFEHVGESFQKVMKKNVGQGMEFS